MCMHKTTDFLLLLLLILPLLLLLLLLLLLFGACVRVCARAYVYMLFFAVVIVSC